MRTTTLKPGLLVSLKTTIAGNRSSHKSVLNPKIIGADGAERESIKTDTTTLDPAEQETAEQTRRRCRSLIEAVCSSSSFGLLCPENRIPALEQAITNAQILANEFNAKAALTRISIYNVCGRVAADDVEAIRAINSELRDLLTEMETGLRELDVDVVRKAASKARALGQMLAPDAEQRMKAAIAIARRAAREIVKAGDHGAATLDQQAIHAMQSARTAFLDFPNEDAAVIEPAITGRALDLIPIPPPPPNWSEPKWCVKPA